MASHLLMIALALVPAAEAPLIGRPREHFYGAVGQQVRIDLKASPTELRAEDPLILTLMIHGADNPETINRPNLSQLAEFAGRFHIDELPEEAPLPGQRVFKYRLRPKSERVRNIPPLLFHYYNPKLGYFATTATQQEIPLKVQPRVPTPVSSGPMQEPDFLFEEPREQQRWDRSWSDGARTTTLLLVLLLPPLAFEFWLLYWRWRYPSAAKLALLRRSRAVRLALDELAAMSARSDLQMADRVAAIVQAFLHERLGLPNHAATPPEVARELACLGVKAELVARAETFFQQCDAARFGPPDEQRAKLPEGAKDLILAVEGST